MIFTTSLLSMLLALVVFAFNWKVNRNALFLSLLMILMGSSQLRHYLIFHGTEPFWLAVLINDPTPLWSMIGACLFFYVRNVLTDRFEFRKSDLRPSTGSSPNRWAARRGSSLSSISGRSDGLFLWGFAVKAFTARKRS